MLKVIFVTEQFPHPTETFVLAQMLGLRQRGCQVVVYTLAAGADTAAAIPADLLRNRISLFKPGQLKRDLCRLMPRMLLNPRCWRAVLRSDLPATQRILLALAVQKHRLAAADVVIAHFGTTAVFARELCQAGVISGALVPFFHGYDLSVHQTVQRYRHGYQQLFRHAATVMTISQLWRDKLISMGCPAALITIQRMGVHSERFNPPGQTQPEAVAEHTIRLLTVARLTEKKGIRYLLDALAVLAGHQLRFHARIIGSGPLLSELQAQAERLQIEPYIEFCGVQPAAEVAAALTDCDIFVLPSVTAGNGDMEGIPVSLMEAMAASKACVSTFHSGIPELITHGQDGLLVPERDVPALAQMLSDLIRQPQLRVKLGQSARQTVVQRFDQQKLDDTLFHVLQNLQRQR